MDELIEKHKKGQGCKSCSSYEKKNVLSQESDDKVLTPSDYCKLFKQKLKNTKACEKFTLNYNVIRDAMFKD